MVTLKKSMFMHNKRTQLVICLLLAILFFPSCDPNSEHICNFDCMVADEKFLISEATCNERAKYAKSCKCGKEGMETFEYGSILGHDCSLKLCDKKYLASENSCISPALYYYSCSRCNATGKETFEVGFKKSHNFNLKVINSETVVPGQKYSCTVPYR